MLSRAHILSEIQRITSENKGVAPGKQRFESETSIREHEWGRYWARWGDALSEAGLERNEWTQKRSDEELLEKLVEYARELGRLPVVREIRLKSLRDASFPSEGAFRRFGGQRALAARLHKHCLLMKHHDVALLCESIKNTTETRPIESSRVKQTLGFVYLIKSARFYKIGRSNAVGRRERELDIALPEAVKLVHSIKTDDPVGIEAYWHKRFLIEGRKVNGLNYQLMISPLFGDANSCKISIVSRGLKDLKEIERPRRLKLSARESLKRTKEFDKRKEQFVGTLRAQTN